MLTCSTINGVAAWRQIMTHEGVIYNGDSIGLLAAIRTGARGIFVLRLSGLAVQIPSWMSARSRTFASCAWPAASVSFVDRDSG